MIELIVLYCLIWGALIIGAFIADFITDVSTSKQTRNVPRGTFDKLTDWDKYVQSEESEV